MKEKVELKTINDIYHLITKDNLDRFMLAFYKTFHTIAEAKEGDHKAFKETNMSCFLWDDNFNKDNQDIVITLNPNDGGKSKEIKF